MQAGFTEAEIDASIALTAKRDEWAYDGLGTGVKHVHPTVAEADANQGLVAPTVLAEAKQVKAAVANGGLLSMRHAYSRGLCQQRLRPACTHAPSYDSCFANDPGETRIASENYPFKSLSECQELAVS